MDIYEEAVMRYLSSGRKRFVSHQFSITKDYRAEWSCPDFVVIDFSDLTVYVAEVTSASSIDSLKKKMLNKDEQWIKPLKSNMENTSEIFKDWDYWVVAFIRKENITTLRNIIKDIPKISIKSLDDVMYPWKRTWKENDPIIDLKKDSAD